MVVVLARLLFFPPLERSQIRGLDSTGIHICTSKRRYDDQVRLPLQYYGNAVT